MLFAVMLIMFGRCCLLIAPAAFPRIPPQSLAVLPTEGHTSFSAGAPYTNLSGVSFPSGSVAYSPLVS